MLKALEVLFVYNVSDMPNNQIYNVLDMRTTKYKCLHMFNGVFRKKILAFFHIFSSGEKRFDGWSDKIIEHKCSIDQLVFSLASIRCKISIWNLPRQTRQPVAT